MQQTLLSISECEPEPAPARSTMSVLLVEQHALVLAALRALIAATPGLGVVAEARSLAAAARLARQHRPDVVLIDSRAFASGEDAGLAAIREAAPGACVLVLADTARAEAGLPEGVHGSLLEDAGPAELCARIAALLGARCANCPFRGACPVPALAVALSRRERQVAVRVAEGLSSKQIAAALGVGTRTVNTYRESLARKLGASSAAVLTRIVLECGLTDPEAAGAA